MLTYRKPLSTMAEVCHNAQFSTLILNNQQMCLHAGVRRQIHVLKTNFLLTGTHLNSSNHFNRTSSSTCRYPLKLNYHSDEAQKRQQQTNEATKRTRSVTSRYASPRPLLRSLKILQPLSSYVLEQVHPSSLWSWLMGSGGGYVLHELLPVS